MPSPALWASQVSVRFSFFQSNVVRVHDDSTNVYSESEFLMLTKLFGGLAIAAVVVGAGVAGTSATSSEPEANACCSKDCCDGCPNCKCDCACCDDCTNGCKCPNKA